MKEKFKNVIELIKDNKGKSIIICILLLISILGVSYAIFFVSYESGEQKVLSGVLDVTYVDGETINATGALPLTEAEVEEYASKTNFTVKNTGNVPVYLEITLTNIDIDPSLKTEDFKYALYKGNTQITTGTFENCGTELVLGKNILQFVTDNTVEYTIALWIRDNGGDQNSMLNSNMSAKIHVEAIDALTLLPTEYQQVEYVESTGTQYIDTGVRETMSIELDIEYMDRNARQLMGIGVSGSHYFGVTNDIFECAGTNFSSSINPYKRRIIDVNYILNDTNKASLSVTIDGETKTTVNGAVVQNNFLLFAPTDEENYRKIYSCYAKLYRCKITDNNGNLIRDLIPCYRKSDNVAGLYDIVNDVFYTNNGTEEFVVGSNVE